MNRKQQAERSRGELLAAARRSFTELGYEGTTVAGVLARVGMARGALYHYFPGGKAELFREVFALVNEEFHARRDAVQELASPLARVRAGFDVFLQLATDPGFARIALVDAPRLIDDQAEPGSSYDALRSQIAQAAELGELRADHDVEALSRALYGAARSLAQLILESDDQPRALEAARRSLDHLLDGISRPSTRTRSRSR